jgi:ribonuclease HII
MIIGIDEAGRGALAGPVVAGAVAFKEELTPSNCEVFALIKDSKKLTDEQRREAYAWLVDNVFWGVALVSAALIDEMGIKPANESAMNQAVENLRADLPKNKTGMATTHIQLQVDGRDKFKFPYPSKDIVKGDEKVLKISAASIIAKVTRDDYMIDAATKFPEFSFETHKGYGAATHLELLNKGVYCDEHRQKFQPLKTWLNQGKLF